MRSGWGEGGAGAGVQSARCEGCEVRCVREGAGAGAGAAAPELVRWRMLYD